MEGWAKGSQLHVPFLLHLKEMSLKQQNVPG